VRLNDGLSKLREACLGEGEIEVFKISDFSFNEEADGTEEQCTVHWKY